MRNISKFKNLHLKSHFMSVLCVFHLGKFINNVITGRLWLVLPAFISKDKNILLLFKYLFPLYFVNIFQGTAFDGGF